MGEGNDLDLVGKVIEDDQPLGGGEQALGEVAVLRGEAGQPLPGSGEVVVYVAYKSSLKSRQILQRDRLEFPTHLSEGGDGILRGYPMFQPPALPEFQASPAILNDEGGLIADEAVPAPPLAAVGTLQEIGERLVPYLEIGGNGGFDIAQDLPIDRDHIAAFGKAVEFSERRLTIHLVTPKRKRP
jgi:hypothetical protein